MNDDRVDQTLAAHKLAVLGVVDIDMPDNARALALIGPGPGFWPHFAQSPEFHDGDPDPMDRWSTRVLSTCADRLSAKAYFPFGGPPYHPFYSWALASGTVWASPIAFLVHEKLGLFVSFRGALAFQTPLETPPDATSPCPSCAQPCKTACPVSALTPSGYDVAACKAYLDTPDGQDCRTQGCRVRRACPVGQGLRDPVQSAFHMQAFAPVGAE